MCWSIQAHRLRRVLTHDCPVDSRLQGQPRNAGAPPEDHVAWCAQLPDREAKACSQTDCIPADPLVGYLRGWILSAGHLSWSHMLLVWLAILNSFSPSSGVISDHSESQKSDLLFFLIITWIFFKSASKLLPSVMKSSLDSVASHTTVCLWRPWLCVPYPAFTLLCVEGGSKGSRLGRTTDVPQHPSDHSPCNTPTPFPTVFHSLRNQLPWIINIYHIKSPGSLEQVTEPPCLPVSWHQSVKEWTLTWSHVRPVPSTVVDVPSFDLPSSLGR